MCVDAARELKGTDPVSSRKSKRIRMRNNAEKKEEGE